MDYEFLWVEQQAEGPRLMMATNGERGAPDSPVYADLGGMIGVVRFDYFVTIMGRALFRGEACRDADGIKLEALVLAPLANGGVPLWHTLNRERFYRGPRRKGENVIWPGSALPPDDAPSSVEPVPERR